MLPLSSLLPNPRASSTLLSFSRRRSWSWDTQSRSAARFSITPGSSNKFTILPSAIRSPDLPIIAACSMSLKTRRSAPIAPAVPSPCCFWISTQKKQSGEDAPPRLIPAVELPNRELLQLTSLFVRTTRRKRRKLFGDFRLVPHHNDGHLFRLNVFRRHFLDVRERNRNHFLHIRFQIVFAQSLQIHIPELSDQRAS